MKDKIVYISRGPSGSGKSFEIKKYVPKEHIFSTDDFWGPEYNFDPSKLHQAHQCNQQRVETIMSRDITPIGVDNTNLVWKEIKPYAKMAQKYGYEIKYIESTSPWWQEFQKKYPPTQDDINNFAEILDQKNQHGVPLETLKRMLQRWTPTEQLPKQISESNIVDQYEVTSYNYKNKRRFDIHYKGTNIAFAIVIPDAGVKQTWLSDLYIKPEFRGKKLTSMLMKKVFEEFPGKIYLRVSSHYDEPLSDDDLIELYKRYGFKEVPGKKYYMVKEQKIMENFKDYFLLKEAAALPFLRFYKDQERGLEPSEKDIWDCISTLEEYYRDYIRWYDSAPHRKQEPVQKRIYNDFKKQWNNILGAMESKDLKQMTIAIDQGINQWHHDFPVVAHLGMEAGFEGDDDAEVAEHEWEEVGGVLIKLGRLPKESPYSKETR